MPDKRIDHAGDVAFPHGDANLELVSDAPDRAEAYALVTDDELVKAWQLCGGECDDPTAEAIASEMERRNIDF